MILLNYQYHIILPAPLPATRDPTHYFLNELGGGLAVLLSVSI